MLLFFKFCNNFVPRRIRKASPPISVQHVQQKQHNIAVITPKEVNVEGFYLLLLSIALRTFSLSLPKHNMTQQSYHVSGACGKSSCRDFLYLLLEDIFIVAGSPNG